MRSSVVLVQFVLLLALFPLVVPTVRAELLPSQVVLVANANSRESLQVAEHYALRRGVPAQQIVKLDLPESETISRAEYDRKMVDPLRQLLQQQNLHQRVRALVTVYGVPLHVGPPDFTAAERALRRDAAGRLEAARAHLVDVEQQVRAIGVPSDTGATIEKAPDQNLPSHERNMALFFRVNRAVLSALEWARQHLPMDAKVDVKLASLFRLYKGLAGVAELHHEVPQSASAPDGVQVELQVKQREGLQLLVGSLDLPVQQNRGDFYRQIELVYGQYGVFVLSAMELELLSDESGDASVDSELGLLWWE